MIFKYVIGWIFILNIVLATYDSQSNYKIIKLKIPLYSVENYLNVLNEYEKVIDELVEPVLTEKVFSSRSGYLFAEWKVPENNVTEIVESLKQHSIIVHKIFNKHKVAKRDLVLRPYVYDIDFESYNYFDDITSENVIKKYHGVEQVYEWLNKLHKKYHNVTEIIDIGNSYEGRPMRVLKLGYALYTNHNTLKNKYIFWFDCGIHAREWTTINACLYTIDQLLKQLDMPNNFVKKLLQKYDLYFLVLTNPDGYDHSLNFNEYWRKNRRRHNYSSCFGVDLNRNFDYHFKKIGASNDCYSEIYAGTTAFSEPEVQSIVNFLTPKKEFILSFITIHSFGSYWLHHWEKTEFIDPRLSKGSYMRKCSKSLLAIKAIENEHNHKYDYGLPINLIEYDASGASDIWAYMVLNATYSFTIELSPTIDQTMEDDDLYIGFHVSESRIKEIVKPAYTGIREFLRQFVEAPELEKRKQIYAKCEAFYKNVTNMSKGYWFLNRKRRKN